MSVKASIASSLVELYCVFYFIIQLRSEAVTGSEPRVTIPVPYNRQLGLPLPE
jgi:hypothetical protein